MPKLSSAQVLASFSEWSKNNPKVKDYVASRFGLGDESDADDFEYCLRDFIGHAGITTQTPKGTVQKILNDDFTNPKLWKRVSKSRADKADAEDWDYDEDIGYVTPEYQALDKTNRARCIVRVFVPSAKHRFGDTFMLVVATDPNDERILAMQVTAD